MARWTHDLSYEECEAWMLDLGLDWDDLRRIAVVKSTQYVLKNRWGAAKRDRPKLRDALERAEVKRKEPTATGAIVASMEEWNRVGETLAKQPELLAAELARVKQIAAGVEKAQAAKLMLAEANETIANALGSVTPAPKKPRK